MKTFDQHLAEVTNRAKPQARDWFTVKNEATAPAAEIMIFNRIGKSPWDDEGGIEATAFNAALSQIPRDREITCRINSVGGNAWEGMAIYSMLRSRRDKVTCKIDGVAASIAAVIACAGKRTIIPKNGMFMIHPAQGMAAGDKSKMTEAAEKLDAHDKAIANVLAEKTGKSQQSMLALMAKGETWMDGATACKEGFCDEQTDEEAATNEAKEFDLSQFRCVPDALRREVSNQAGTAHADGRKEKHMDKTKIVALLKEHGVEVANDASDEQLLAAVASLGAKAKASTTAPQNVVDLENRVKDISQKLANARRQSVTAEVEKLIGECRIPASQKEVCVENALKDEKHLDFLRALEPKLPGAAPMNTVEAPDIQVGASLAEISNAVKRFDEPFAAIVRGNNIGMKAVTNAAYARAKMIEKHRAQMEGVFNAAGDNTVATELKRSVILQTIVRDFARRVLPLNAFSTVFSNVPLEGTDKVEVPYYDLDTTATRTWVAGTGYSVVGTTTTDKREVSVTTRRFLDHAFTSQDIARQPFLNIQQNMALKAENLGAAVIDDVLSLVTAANYGAAAITSGADAFDSDDVADLVTACKLWPEAGRSLFLDTAYHVALLKDPSFKAAFANAVSVMKEGSIGPRLMGFDYVENPRLPGNSENLVGFAAHKSAILFASAPIAPVEEVRNAGTMYQMYVDPITGIIIEYRRFGNNTLDQGMHIVECNYGYGLGNYYQSASKLGAIRRIVSA